MADSKRKLIDLTGQTFGRLIVIRQVESRNQQRRWLADCSCGNQTIVTTKNLNNGQTRSCGCLQYSGDGRRTHGMTNTPTYVTWLNMRARCLNPDNPAYPRYGGRGITIDPRWSNFATFLADMGERPNNTSLERCENDGNYTMENCIWGTDEEQANNKRNNHLLTLQGRTQSMAMWAKELHLSYTTIRRRLNTLGWSTERALTTPIRTIQFR